MKSIKTIFAVFALAIGLTGCATSGPFANQEGASTSYKKAQKPERVEMITIVAVRNVALIDQPAPGATTTGAILGGIAGIALGDKLSSNKSVRNAVGAVAGIAGAGIGAQAGGKVKAQEIVYTTERGQKMTLVQNIVDGVLFKKGQEAMLIGGMRIAPIFD